MQDLLAGHIDLIIDQAVNALPYVRNGAVKAYAVTARNRLAALPDVPTVDEAGLPKFHISIWHALWAPKGTSKEIVAKLNEAVVNALTNANVRQRLTLDVSLDGRAGHVIEPRIHDYGSAALDVGDVTVNATEL